MSEGVIFDLRVNRQKDSCAGILKRASQIWVKAVQRPWKMTPHDSEFNNQKLKLYVIGAQ